MVADGLVAEHLLSARQALDCCGARETAWVCPA